MSRYIDADALIQKMPTVMDMQDTYLPIHFKEWLIDEMPTADVRENVRGEWVSADGEVFECTNCGFALEDMILGAFYNYCPNCGADMRGGTE